MKQDLKPRNSYCVELHDIHIILTPRTRLSSGVAASAGQCPADAATPAAPAPAVSPKKSLLLWY